MLSHGVTNESENNVQLPNIVLRYWKQDRRKETSIKIFTTKFIWAHIKPKTNSHQNAEIQLINDSGNLC